MSDQTPAAGKAIAIPDLETGGPVVEITVGEESNSVRIVGWLHGDMGYRRARALAKAWLRAGMIEVS